MLLGSVVDSWDKLREAAAEALGALPAPLPGLGSPGAVADLVRWGRRLIASPRVRESDAGAGACSGTPIPTSPGSCLPTCSMAMLKPADWLHPSNSVPRVVIHGCWDNQHSQRAPSQEVLGS